MLFLKTNPYGVRFSFLTAPAQVLWALSQLLCHLGCFFGGGEGGPFGHWQKHQFWHVSGVAWKHASAIILLSAVHGDLKSSQKPLHPKILLVIPAFFWEVGMGKKGHLYFGEVSLIYISFSGQSSRAGTVQDWVCLEFCYGFAIMCFNDSPVHLQDSFTGKCIAI